MKPAKSTASTVMRDFYKDLGEISDKIRGALSDLSSISDAMASFGRDFKEGVLGLDKDETEKILHAVKVALKGNNKNMKSLTVVAKYLKALEKDVKQLEDWADKTSDNLSEGLESTLDSKSLGEAGAPLGSLGGTVEAFLRVLSSFLTQQDKRESKKNPNTYRLSHYMGAVGKVRKDVSKYLKRDDEEAMKALKKAMGGAFSMDLMRKKFSLSGVERTSKQIDRWLKDGIYPSTTTKKVKRPSEAVDALSTLLEKLPGKTTRKPVPNYFNKETKTHRKRLGKAARLKAKSAIKHGKYDSSDLLEPKGTEGWETW